MNIKDIIQLLKKYDGVFCVNSPYSDELRNNLVKMFLILIQQTLLVVTLPTRKTVQDYLDDELLDCQKTDQNVQFFIFRMMIALITQELDSKSPQTPDMETSVEQRPFIGSNGTLLPSFAQKK